MMIIAAINTVNYGSTGRIMLGILEAASANNTVYAYYGVGKTINQKIKAVKVGRNFSIYLSTKLAHLTGLAGCYSFVPTLKLIYLFKKNHVEIIHLHNLHISFINLPMLFKFIKRENVRVVWTLHDCWTFTGHCPHFTFEKCSKWETGCFDCTKFKKYPVSSFDNSKFMWRLKKKWFTGVPNMTIVTPSQWLAGLVKRSYLKEYDVKVINNGIDLSIFKPTPSDFRLANDIPNNKFIILGVAFDWSPKKGLDVFIELSKRLDSNKYQIVLVGTDEITEEALPQNIISIRKTSDRKELAKIYTAADLFLNPTREDTFPTVNIEALACGTPGITFNTGGSPECYNSLCGLVLNTNNIDIIQNSIIKVCEGRVFKSNDCIERAKQFNMQDCFYKYISLYKDIIC